MMSAEKYLKNSPVKAKVILDSQLIQINHILKFTLSRLMYKYSGLGDYIIFYDINMDKKWTFFGPPTYLVL